VQLLPRVIAQSHWKKTDCQSRKGLRDQMMTEKWAEPMPHILPSFIIHDGLTSAPKLAAGDGAGDVALGRRQPFTRA
jgi:hypothetical protein